MTDDVKRSHGLRGIVLAVLSALAFGLSGTVSKYLMDRRLWVSCQKHYENIILLT